MEAKKRKLRGALSPRGMPVMNGKGCIVQEVRQGARRFVQKYVRCGKRCSVCNPDGANYDPLRPGHGPYWYLEVTKNGKTFRKNIGRELVTQEKGEESC